MTELTKVQRNGLRDRLLELRRDLGTMVESTREGAGPVDLGEPIGRLSRMAAIQQAKLASANRDAAERRLRLVTAALGRLAETPEEYGLCIGCDENIGHARLLARPETTLCVRCQSSREASGRGRG